MLAYRHGTDAPLLPNVFYSTVPSSGRYHRLLALPSAFYLETANELQRSINSRCWNPEINLSIWLLWFTNHIPKFCISKCNFRLNANNYTLIILTHCLHVSTIASLLNYDYEFIGSVDIFINTFTNNLDNNVGICGNYNRCYNWFVGNWRLQWTLIEFQQSFTIQLSPLASEPCVRNSIKSYE